MTDYYDRLGAQLADLAERDSPRRWVSVRPRIRAELVAVPAGVLLVIAVSAVFLTLGSGHGAGHVGRPVVAGGVAPSVIHNYAHGHEPAPSGLIACTAVLWSPGVGASPNGGAVVYLKPSGRALLSITATGLKPASGHHVYAVWAVGLGSSLAKLVGVVEPPVGRDGKLVADGLLPRGASGSYQVLITVQRSESVKAPGRTVLEGSISF